VELSLFKISVNDSHACLCSVVEILHAFPKLFILLLTHCILQANRYKWKPPSVIFRYGFDYNCRQLTFGELINRALIPTHPHLTLKMAGDW